MLASFAQLHQRGITIVNITHSHEVACHSQRIITMSDGRVTADYLHPTDLEPLTLL